MRVTEPIHGYVEVFLPQSAAAERGFHGFFLQNHYAF